jgi:hypothetical protein
MASFKRLKRSDVISVPYVANKNWSFNYGPYPNDQHIKVFKGTNITGSFSTITDPVTEGQYERLIYNQINHLFYQQYSSSVQNLNTSSLISSLYYDGATQIRATGSYFDYNDNPGLIKTFPTGANESIRILSINQSLYGEQILPYAFNLTSSVFNIIDDGIGNLIDKTNSNNHVGNIFYSHGIAIITNQDYQLMFPLPPLAQYKENTFFDTDTTRNTNLTGSVIARSGILNTGSLKLFNLESNLFTSSSNGVASLSNSAGLGSYYTNYTFSASLNGTNLISNDGLLKVNIKNNCDFAIAVYENPFASPSPTPTPTPTITPTITPSPSITPSPGYIAPSFSPTPTLTPTPTVTPTITVTPSITITPSITTTPSITPTPTLTPTLTPTPVYYGFPINIGYSTSELACADNTPNITIYGANGGFLTNTTFYTDTLLTSPYFGSSFYFQNTATTQYVRIGDSGENLGGGTC